MALRRDGEAPAPATGELAEAAPRPTDEENKQAMIVWLTSIDPVPPSPEIITKLANKLTTDGYKTYQAMEGMAREDINEISEIRAERAFIQRVVNNLELLKRLNAAPTPGHALSFPPAPPSSSSAAALAPFLGMATGANAQDIAKMLNPVKSVDVQKLLKDAKQEYLPTNWKGDHDLYAKLVSDRKKGLEEKPPKSYIFKLVASLSFI